MFRELRLDVLAPDVRKKLVDAVAGRRSPRPIVALTEKAHGFAAVFLTVGLVLLLVVLIATGNQPLGVGSFLAISAAGAAMSWGLVGIWQRRQWRNEVSPGRYLYVCELIDARAGRCLVADLMALTEMKVRDERFVGGSGCVQLQLITAEGAVSLPFVDVAGAERAMQSLRAARQQYRAAVEQEDAAALAALDPFHLARQNGTWERALRPEARRASARQYVMQVPLETLLAGAAAGLAIAAGAIFALNIAHDEMAFTRAKMANSVAAYQQYLDRPKARHEDEVRARLIPAAALHAARREASAAALHRFIEAYPSTPQAAEARTFLHGQYETARSRAAAHSSGEGAKALQRLFDWLEAHDSPEVGVRFTNQSLKLAQFDTALEEALRRTGAPSHLIEPITPILNPRIVGQMEDGLLGEIEKGFGTFATPDMLTLKREGAGARVGPPTQPKLVVSWSAAPRMAPDTQPMVDRGKGFIYWPLVFNFEVSLLVPGQEPYAERFEFEPAKFIPSSESKHSLYLLMAEVAFDEVAQRTAKSFFPQNPPERRSALGTRDESGMLGVRLGSGATASTRERFLGSATAFAISPLGYIATAQHFTRAAQKYRVQMEGGPVEAELVVDDRENDLAILKLKKPLPGVLSIRSSGTVKLAEPMATLGYPNFDLQGVEPKFGRGEISSLAGMLDDKRHFQISVPIQPGNSGGPLVDLAGRVVGVIKAQLRGGQIVNYAVKSDLLLKLIEKVPELREVKPAESGSVERKLEDVVEELRRAVVLIKGYAVEK